eukprot:CAMPEP_0113936538 /NCGR_PEP_ID=MMETSP1339-20121228/3438_1 /TAXON_ID=94617 /ORGANISM="Fibrocapsa japonica" /LENGTH=190 /DNA_ID=CAMNT_0000939055 /DNA_START=34 /DNA_END=606 /DNA_ORIENTATION=+ /assembly_acc=CAM_ASM_000762
MEYVGSKFEGEVEDGRFVGEGEYTYPDGTTYVGGFKDGMFHGKGTLYYGNGAYHATWENGKEISGEYVFGDGLKYQASDGLKGMEWKYCSEQDRRFYTEMLNGIRPAGVLQQTNNRSQAPKIPEGCYHIGDGYFNPATKAIHAHNNNEELRKPGQAEIDWILTKCRLGSSNPDRGDIPDDGTLASSKQSP